MLSLPAYQRRGSSDAVRHPHATLGDCGVQPHPLIAHAAGRFQHGSGECGFAWAMWPKSGSHEPDSRVEWLTRIPASFGVWGMDLKRLEEAAAEQLARHGLVGWTFRLADTKRRLGV